MTNFTNTNTTTEMDAFIKDHPQPLLQNTIYLNNNHNSSMQRCVTIDFPLKEMPTLTRQFSTMPPAFQRGVTYSAPLPDEEEEMLPPMPTLTRQFSTMPPAFQRGVTYSAPLPDEEEEMLPPMPTLTRQFSTMPPAFQRGVTYFAPLSKEEMVQNEREVAILELEFQRSLKEEFPTKPMLKRETTISSPLVLSKDSDLYLYPSSTPDPIIMSYLTNKEVSNRRWDPETKSIEIIDPDIPEEDRRLLVTDAILYEK
jgi:hypothetical protein